MVEGMLRADLTGMHFTSKIGSCSPLERPPEPTSSRPLPCLTYSFISVFAWISLST